MSVNKFIILQGKNAGFIWFNFYLDFVAQNTIKNPGSSLVTASIFTGIKAMETGVHLEKTMLIP